MSPASRIVLLSVLLLVLFGLCWVTVSYFSNYAKKTAGPLEAALVKAGAVKQCSRGDNGRGWDNRAPRYYAIYEMPGDRQEALDSFISIAKDNGFSLAKVSDRADDVSYADTTSKLSAYSNLEPEPIKLSLDVFKSSTYTGKGDRFCTVTKRDNPPEDTSTIRFTVGLPEFRR